MRRALCLVALLSLLASVPVARGADDALASGFQNPPDSAKPQTWWHWMNGNVTKEGITADLEAMKRVGIGGAQIFIADCDIPPGPVRFMSPEFREMFKHAVTEADRLGLQLCMHNCAGWSSSGGPWNTPEHAMQFVTTSETRVTGPTQFAEVLPQPPTKLDFYRDIEVLAFPTPAAERESLMSQHPKITTSVAGADPNLLIDGKRDTEIDFPRPSPGKPGEIRIEFPSAITVACVTLTPGEGLADASGAIEASDDGKTFHELRAFLVPHKAARATSFALDPVSTTARVFRIRFDTSGRNQKPISISEVDLSSAKLIENAQTKAGFLGNPIDTQSDDASPTGAVARDSMVDLTDKLGPDGKLTWDVPAGDWTIQRIGYTPTGADNHPAPPEGTGPECDKFSTEALDAHWAGYVQKILDDVGPLAGKALNNCLIDSYEVGDQNWTPKMKQEFQSRRGYDPSRFLPAMVGRVVDSPEVSERFLWDLRRTIADLFAENYYGHFAELCHAHGLMASIEPYTGPYESLQCGKPADIVMGEFWTGSNGEQSVKLASSVAHIYGKQIVGTESFTAAPPAHGRWQEDPYALKALGDLMWTQGINRFIFHRYAMQPWMDKYPGMTMGQWGFHMDRTNTWFEQSTGWLKYIARSQYMLQQGQFIADAAYFCGESAPVETKTGNPPLPAGYDYDSINAEAIESAKAQDGRIVLASGMSYAVLVLPPKLDRITPQLAQKLHDLVNDGATVYGAKPRRSPSLQDYPKCDETVRTIGDQVWGDCDGVGVTEHAFGKGKVVNGKGLADIFASAKLKPDFEVSPESRAKLAYIHRLAGDDDVYFVSNQRDSFSQAKCIFRITGKRPELWHPDTGVMEPAPIYSDADGRTSVSLQFDPVGSVFVIFRKSGASTDHAVEITSADSQQPTSVAPKITIEHAVYESTDGAGSLDVTQELGAIVQSGVDSVDVTNGTFGSDPSINHTKQLAVEYSVNGVQRKATVNEGEKFGPMEMTNSHEPPAYELTTSADGQVSVLAWSAGAYDVKASSGKITHVQASSIAPSVEIAGPWELDLPPKWGAPDKVTLDKLISWTDHADKGVKYFSGTATYLNQIDIAPEMLGADRLVYLDLGRVKNLAQVKLNGTDLGILWKPPFRVDLTGAAHAGKNALEIRVTNLWPNRLIGDEKMGEDAEWNGKRLVRWPQWLLDGKPSPSGRVTFTTWHHWTADMQPLESGLLGPVKLQSVQQIKVQ